MLVLVYVDNMALTAKDITTLQRFKARLSAEFEISDLGKLRYILGIQVKWNRQLCTISINQTAYIHQILTQFGMSECAPVSTPSATKQVLSTLQSPKDEGERLGYLEFANGLKYLEIVGVLLYATQMQPDIQYSVSIIAQYGGNPGKTHLEAAKHILHYLKGTARMALVFRRSGSREMDLVGWTDSNWAQDINLHCSIGRFVFDVAGGSVLWVSQEATYNCTVNS